MKSVQKKSRGLRSFLWSASLILLPLTAAAAPLDWQSAAEDAERHIAKSRRLGGEEHAAKAREILAPWWNDEDVPGKIRLQRATLLQRDHHFDEALADLNFLLKKNPELTEAWLMKTTVLTVSGRYEEARQAAVPLFALATPLLAVTAGTAPTSCHGNLAESYRVLEASLKSHPDEAAGVRGWAHTALAEMAVRMGQPGAAGEHFRSALLLDPFSPYLLKNYANFLLDQNWSAKAAELIEPHRDYFPVVWMKIRKDLNASPEEMAALISAYEARLASKREDHGHSHGRDEAVFYLEIKGDPREAIHQASANWESQREAADLLILIKSAIAAEDEVTLATATKWIKERGFEDARLAALGLFDKA